MSSTLRGFAAQSTIANSPATKTVPLMTPSYYNFFDEAPARMLPIPFIYSNGECDIHIQDDVQNQLLDNTNPTWSCPYSTVRPLGGTGLVSSLGANMITWLKNQFSWYWEENVSDITDVAIHTAGVMTKVQIANNFNNSPVGGFDFNLNNPAGLMGFGESAAHSSYPPPSDDFSFNGSVANNYSTVWIFKAPMTISANVAGTTRYFTVQSTYDNNGTQYWLWLID
jgi:hypothetical protein